MMFDPFAEPNHENSMQQELYKLSENQGINASDRATDDFVLVDGVRTEGADVTWDESGVTIDVPDSDQRHYPWNEVTSVDGNDENGVVIGFEDGKSVVIACRILV